MIERFRRQLQVPRNRRFLWTGTLSALLIFLLPLTGWLPLLLLWLWNLSVSFRESAGSRVRFFYGLMFVLAAALALLNVGFLFLP